MIIKPGYHPHEILLTYEEEGKTARSMKFPLKAKKSKLWQVLSSLASLASLPYLALPLSLPCLPLNAALLLESKLTLRVKAGEKLSNIKYQVLTEVQRRDEPLSLGCVCCHFRHFRHPASCVARGVK